MAERPYYAEFHGEYATVHTRNNSYCGRVISVDHRKLELCPSLVSEPEFFITKEGELGRRTNFRIERIIPTIVDTVDVAAVEPLEETAFDRMEDILQQARILRNSKSSNQPAN